uniref:Peptide chain release factor 3 n=1 Tax=Magnetococcus massalia (strain MO-1) TaxID=451514 RepID=A0A1S7LEZ8_MAGMO|nr:peptide chain release factor RF-3; GTP-binding factor [Candidatus Magnetococcus massalia]
MSHAPSPLAAEIDKRRTFAIISHPDAGKTTLTEKLLLFGGAIQLAGAVKARGDKRRNATSDWMKVEQERGISVTASVMTFEYSDLTFNLLDTPGHADFSEDTYRTLTAVDSAVMVLDVAKGIETQTRKLFEVCRLRDVPITTFINKLDREGQDPFALLDEIEQSLALDVTPASWPIGMGREFLGCYDLLNDQLIFMEKSRDKVAGSIQCNGLDDPRIDELLPEDLAEKLREDVEMVRELCPPFDLKAYREGTLTPVYFGSAVNNFGVKELLDGIGRNAPPPRPQKATEREVEASEKKLTGFVFKIQANMDPKHRDRIAFFRICSGQYKRGMKVKHVRSDKQLNLHNPVLFLAQDRERAEEAFAGDILGIPNHGNLRIGDTLTEGEILHYTGIPSFAPEMLRKVRPDDPMKAKHLGRTLVQLGEEGAARVFKSQLGGDWIIGVLGALQFEVLGDRIRTEFGIPVHYESTSLHTAQWVEADDHADLKTFLDRNSADLAEDHDGAPVFLARNAWHLNNAKETFPNVRFLKTKEQTV